MKQVKIINLQLKNFKGIASGTFAFNGANTEIVADVMQGKSTIKDAYLWCLGLEIDNFYPCDKNNKLIDGLETRVELFLDIDGIEYTLSRSAKIKYKNKQFDGFKKDIYEFDGVPCTATDYKAKLCDLFGVVDFETLKYLIVLNHFNEIVNWKERRALIYSLFVDKQEIDGLKNEERYNLIANELKKGKSSADIATMLNSENNRIADSKRKNEILLADKQSELAGYSKINYESIESELETVEQEIKEEQERIDIAYKTSAKQVLEEKIFELDRKKRKLQFEYEREKDQKWEYCEHLNVTCETLLSSATRLEERINKAVEEYNQLKVSHFDGSNPICPTCHQPLKQDDIDKIMATWKSNKEERLSRLKTDIMELKKRYNEIKEGYTNTLAEFEEEKKHLLELKPSDEIAELENGIKLYRLELDKLGDEEIDTSTLEELKARRNFLIVELGKMDAYKKLKEKIESLYAEQKQLVNAEIVLAKKRQQLEQYTLEIISLVNESINRNFDGVKFKLFEELTATASKSIKETCICLNNGIEYSSQSTGQKANTNLIVVSTLQQAFGVNLPIFLDDASILHLKKEPSNQLIYLLNEKGKKLDCTRIDEIY